MYLFCIPLLLIGLYLFCIPLLLIGLYLFCIPLLLIGLYLFCIPLLLIGLYLFCIPLLLIGLYLFCIPLLLIGTVVPPLFMVTSHRCSLLPYRSASLLWGCPWRCVCVWGGGGGGACIQSDRVPILYLTVRSHRIDCEALPLRCAQIWTKCRSDGLWLDTCKRQSANNVATSLSFNTAAVISSQTVLGQCCPLVTNSRGLSRLPKLAFMLTGTSTVISGDDCVVGLDNCPPSVNQFPSALSHAFVCCSGGGCFWADSRPQEDLYSCVLFG